MIPSASPGDHPDFLPARLSRLVESALADLDAALSTLPARIPGTSLDEHTASLGRHFRRTQRARLRREHPAFYAPDNPA